jgi:hypothetical protein
MSDKTIAVAQPTFLPWIGWFDLVDQVDLFIILDDVAFSKQSWQQRNRIRTPYGLEYLSVPVRTAGRTGQLILDCEVDNQLFVAKVIKSLKVNYSRAPFFLKAIEEFTETFKCSLNNNKLVELNSSIISLMTKWLDIKTPMIFSSTIGVNGKRGEYIAAICENVGAKKYISPAGAEEYLIEDKASFDRRGIEVLIQVYEHPSYDQQFNPFIPFASALDLIFNVGPASGDVMRSGRRPARLIAKNKVKLKNDN